MKSVNNQIHVHIDADAFFASVEQVLHRELKGKALVVGQNGGIVSALSYPAKAMGIPRVMPIISVRKHYPQVSVVSSDFYAYGIFSDRMDRIIRDHLPNLVKNSIDECSANMDAWVKNFDAAKIFVEIIKKELELKLGCTFSFGIARTPLLAKLASGLNKPNGISILTDETVEQSIYHLPVHYISGIGAQTYKSLIRKRIYTIGDFARADYEWLKSAFSITLPALHKQILGSATRIPKQKETIKDMSRAQTFPPTNNYDYLYSQASMNIEHLTKRMRRMNVFSKRICIQLRDQELAYTQSCITLTSPTRNPEYLLHELDILLKNIYQENTLYRQVSIRCTGLEEQIVQDDLFGNSKISQSKDSTLSIIDSLEIRFGKSCIGLATSLPAKDKLGKLYTQHTQGDTYPHPLLPGEEIQKRLIYPFLGIIN